MKCEVAQQYVALAAYEELSDDERHALEQHLAGCPRCREEFEAVQALQRVMAFLPDEEAPANLLAQARMRLEEALDNMPRVGWLLRAEQSMMGALAALGRAPVAASALLVFGAALGGFTGFQISQRMQPSHLPAASEFNSSGGVQAADTGPIANVSGIVRDPSSENVEVWYNRLVPETIHGTLDDPQIKQLLLLAAQNRMDPAVQQNSVGLLAEECRDGHQCPDGPVLHALLVALRYDRNAGVRLRALNGLEPYVAEDMHVRDSVLEALMSDPDAAIRSRAIELLQPVQADSSVQAVLHTVASEDDNPHIRTVSREVLDQLPQIQ